MGLFKDFFGSKQKTETESKQTIHVPSWLEDRSKKIINKADEILDTPFKRYSTDDRVAPLNQDIMNAFDLGRKAVGTWKPSVDEATRLTTAAANSQWNTDTAKKWMDPYTEAVLKRAQEDMNRNYQQEQMAANAKRVAMGGFLRPNAQANNQQSRNFSDYMKESGDLSNRAMSQSYQAALDAWMRDRAVTSDIAKQLGAFGAENARLNAADFQQLLQTGQYQRAYDQQRRDFDWQEFNREINEPKSNMSWMTQLLGTVPYTKVIEGNTTSTTSNSPSIMDAIERVANLGVAGATAAMGMSSTPSPGASTSMTGVPNPYGLESQLGSTGTLSSEQPGQQGMGWLQAYGLKPF